MSLAIHWFRRDLRLTDNSALAQAARGHEQVLPVYIVSQWQGVHRWTGAPRQEFLCGCLESLAKNLEAKGGRLLVRQGEAVQVLESLVRETGATAIYCNRDPDPHGRAVEARLGALAAQMGFAFHAVKDAALHERDEVLTATGTPFKVFTPYAKAWFELEAPLPGPSLGRIAAPHLPSDPRPTLATWGLRSTAVIVDPGEAAARRRLSDFLDGPILNYAPARDFPAQPGTSRLSQDLRYGTLSIREIYARCREVLARRTAEQRRSVQTFISELIWREFYLQVLWHRPSVLEEEFNEDYRGLPWRSDAADLDRWCAGQTGFPIVDAGMRELTATGFMHNRVRMITAMFLTKDLHLDWRAGESWFMRQLVDGEIASNNGGWQWSASTGTDAAPYFRIQNPWRQARRFDPEGAYMRRWVPELRDTPTRLLFAPPESGVPLAKGYPLPMVDHHRERDAALAMYRSRP